MRVQTKPRGNEAVTGSVQFGPAGKVALALVLGVVTLSCIAAAQSGTMQTFAGLNTVQYGVIGQTAAPDITIAVGTLQVCEHVNSAYQCWWKSGANALQPVNFLGSTNPKLDAAIWSQNSYNGGNTPHCSRNNTPNSELVHDNVYNVWILEKRIHNTTTGHDYLCGAISNIDDVSQSNFGWFGFEFDLDTVIPKNAQGDFYFPDYPQVGLWQTSNSASAPYAAAKDQAMWISYDLQDLDNHTNTAGILVCAVDIAGLRASTSTPYVNNAHTPACVLPHPISAYTARDNWVPAHNSDTTPPNSTDGEMFSYIIEPAHDGHSYLTDPNHTQGIEQWTIDWTAATPMPTAVGNWDLPSTMAGGDQMGCFTSRSYYNTVCIPQPSTASTGIYIDSVGDRQQQFFHYTANNGHGGVWTLSRIIQSTPSSTTLSQTEADIRTLQWNGSAIGIATDNTFTDLNDPQAYVFLPSVVRDKVGNLQGIWGISGTGASEHPGLSSMYYIANTAAQGTYGYIANPSTSGDAKDTDSSNYRWGDWYSGVLDPSDSCTVWVAGEYLAADRTAQNYWYTQMAKLPALDSCSTQPPITLSPTSASFGTQAIGTTSSPQSITVNNTGTSSFTVNSVVASGSYTKTDTCSGSVIQAGGSCTVRVTFSPSSVGSQPGAITINDTTASSPHVVGLTGTGASPISVTPALISFGNVSVGSTSGSHTMTVSNNTGVTLNIGVAASGEYGVAATGASPCGSTLAAGASCTAGVTFTPTVNGTTRGAVTVTANSSYSPQIVSLSGVGVNGSTGPLTFSPINVTFTNIVAGTTTATKSVTVTNSSSTGITINSVTVSGEYSLSTTSKPCSGTLAAGAKCTLAVSFSPNGAGTLYGSILVTDNASINKQIVSLSSTSVLPATIAPATIGFGNQTVGSTSSPQIVTITNNQSTALTLAGITASGDYLVIAAGQTPCGASVPALGQCTVGVEFSPSQAGAIAGALTVNHSASNTPLLVGLSGTGQ